MSDFDYEGPNVPETVVADVVSEISNQGKLPPLTHEQVERRKIDAEIYLLECRRREEERRAEAQRRLAEAQALAEEDRRIARQQESSKAQRERREQIAKETQAAELRSLRLAMAKQDWFKSQVETAARSVARQQALQHRQTLIDDLDRMISPPAPPEPEIVYEPESEPDTFCGVKIVRWR